MARRIVAAAACAVVAAMGAASAFGGEITGNGKWIVGDPSLPLHGKSICAFSGQNDEFQLGIEGAARVQSFGQDVSGSVHGGTGPLGGVPGAACNPS